MKTNYSFGKAGIAAVLMAALTGCTTYVVQQPEPQPAYVPPPPPEPAPVVVEPAPPPAVVVIQRDDDFYQPLSPYGQWVDVGPYGRCWRPTQVAGDWRPYANGHWETTGDGWYWVSDEPWGWATYHYGRWQLTPQFGWIWVPATQWAPAWVSWREGGGYVGWAPLPPEPRPGIDVSVTIAPAAFCFVDERRMHDPVRPATVIVNNTTIINRTKVINKTKVVNRIVVNEGPRVDEVERVSGHRFQAVSTSDLRHREEAPVAERHHELRAPAQDRNPRPVRQPEPRESGPQQVRTPERPQPARGVDQPVLKKPVGPEPEPNRPHPIEAKPTREVQPVDHRKEQNEKVQKPAEKPAREVRPTERAPEQPQPNADSRGQRPDRFQPQARPAQEPVRERTVKPPKQQREDKAPKNQRPAKEQKNKGHQRETGGTNTDNGNLR